MRKSTFLFFKGLGLLFAVLCGIGTAVLGWYDGADWMNIVTFSIAVTGLILNSKKLLQNKGVVIYPALRSWKTREFLILGVSYSKQ